MRKSACVTPLKITTIPRLGLTVAIVSAKVGVMLQEEFNYTNLKQYFCTDSKEVPVFGCIDNDTKRFHTFVTNRVQMIRSSTYTSKGDTLTPRIIQQITPREDQVLKN